MNLKHHVGARLATISRIQQTVQNVQQLSPYSLPDLFSTVIRYRRRFICVALFTMTLSMVVVFLLPKKFESEAWLFVRLGRSSTGIDPASIGPTISIQDSRETEINSIIDLLQSRGLAEEVVGRIGEARICEKYSWLERQLDNATDWIGSLVPEDAGSPRLAEEENVINKVQESAIRKFQSNLRIHSPRKSTTLSVVYRAASPATARNVVDVVVEVFQEMHIRSNKSSGAVDFFAEQFTDEKGRLRNSESEFLALKNKAGILSLAGARDSLQAEQSSIKLQLLQASADYSAASGRVDDLRLSMASMPLNMESESTAGIEAGASDAMRERLFELEILEKEYSAKYQDNHPNLVLVRTQLADARKILETQPKEREHKVTAVNPVLIELRKEMFIAQANAASIKTRLDNLQLLDGELLRRMAELNSLEVIGESLQRDIDISRDNHRTYANKLEEARINAALDHEALTNVSVVSKPTIRFAHTSPNRLLLTIVASAISILTGLFVTLGSDFFARSQSNVRTQEAVMPVRRQPVMETEASAPSRTASGSAAMESMESLSPTQPR